MSVINTHKKLVEAARHIEDQWRTVDNDIEAFADIAAEPILSIDLSTLGDLSNIPELLEDSFIGSLQEPSTFSDVYIKLFDNNRFYIELLNWWGSDINIHDHDFSGLQCQLTGHSLNVEYGFKEEHWSPKLTVGEVSVKKAEVWQPGDHSFVRPGTVAAHTVNHLSFPTVSLLVRTHGNAAFGPQRNYFPPYVAGDYGVADIIFRKRVRLLRTLARGPKAPFEKAFKRVIDSQTDTENLFLITKMFDILFEQDRVHLLNDFMAKRGDAAQAIVSACAYHRASDFIINHVKRLDDLTDDHILACSVLGSCFDKASFEKIIHDIAQQGYALNFSALIEDLEQRMTAPDRSYFNNILELFDVQSFRNTYGEPGSYSILKE